MQAVDVNIGKRNFPFAGDFSNLRTADKDVAACQAFPNRRNLLAVLAQHKDYLAWFPCKGVAPLGLPHPLPADEIQAHPRNVRAVLQGDAATFSMRLHVDSPPLFYLDRTLELPEDKLVRNILEGREVVDVAVCVVTAPPVNQTFVLPSRSPTQASPRQISP